MSLSTGDAVKCTAAVYQIMLDVYSHLQDTNIDAQSYRGKILTISQVLESGIFNDTNGQQELGVMLLTSLLNVILVVNDYLGGQNKMEKLDHKRIMSRLVTCIDMIASYFGTPVPNIQYNDADSLVDAIKKLGSLCPPKKKEPIKKLSDYLKKLSNS